MKLTLNFMRRYLNFGTYYTFEFYTSILAEIIMLAVIYSLWSALYAQGGAGIEATREQLISYAVIGMLFTRFVMFGGCHVYISDKIRRGTIDSDIVHPINMQLHMFIRDLAEKGSRFVMFLLPISLLFLFISGTWIPLDFYRLVLFIVSVALAFVILFAINYLFGMLAFVTLNIQNVSFAFGALICFLAGQIIPLWMFPDSLRRIVLMLPFRSIFDVPMSIYIGHLNGPQLQQAIARQIVWLVILIILGQLCWKMVQKHVISQGG
jgi:ABC-2 type transport system permease protein